MERNEHIPYFWFYKSIPSFRLNKNMDRCCNFSGLKLNLLSQICNRCHFITQKLWCQDNFWVLKSGKYKTKESLNFDFFLSMLLMSIISNRMSKHSSKKIDTSTYSILWFQIIQNLLRSNLNCCAIHANQNLSDKYLMRIKYIPIINQLEKTEIVLDRDSVINGLIITK